MTINYCDYAAGNDSTGNGSASNPYKTIDKASTGLTGGDEVRCAKSPDDTALTGTLGFTEGSTTVTGSGTSFTTELSVMDFIKGGDGYWYEVTAIASNTSLTIHKVYFSSSQAGVNSYKLGIVDTGQATAGNTIVQQVSSSGVSESSVILISGGWDLSTETQTGETFFVQTGTDRYGYGFYSNYKNYVTTNKINFFRYYYNFYLNKSNYYTLQQAQSISAGNNGIYINSCNYPTLVDPISCGNGAMGIYIYVSCVNPTLINPIVCGNSHGMEFRQIYHGIVNVTSPICNWNNGYGIFIYYRNVNINMTNVVANNNANGLVIDNTAQININKIECNDNTSYGIYFDNICYNAMLQSVTCNNNTTGISSRYSDIVINDYSTSGNTTDYKLVDSSNNSEVSELKIQNFNGTANDNRQLYPYGESKSNTIDARSNICLEMAPTSDTYYIRQSFFYRAESGVAQTLSAYIKSSATFNGDVQMAVYFNNKEITSYADVTPTVAATYEKKEIIADAGDITQDGVLELRIKTRGTLGSIYIDDLNTA